MPASASYVSESSVKVISRSIIMSDEVSDMLAAAAVVLSTLSFLDILSEDIVVLQVVDEIVSLLALVTLQK